MKFRDYLDKQLADPEFKAVWDELEPEYQILQQILMLRKEQHLTQEQLAALSGIDRSDVSRLENANANPSIRTLSRIAGALGKKLQISFV